MAKERRDVIGVCCMKNEVGDVVSDAEGVKDIWRKYIEKLLNAENDWDCPEVKGSYCLIRKKMLHLCAVHTDLLSYWSSR